MPTTAITKSTEVTSNATTYFEKIDSASLHKSYLHLYDKKIIKDKKLLEYHNKLLELVNNKMEKFKAHNPLVDSFMTVFIFLLMKK